jgi:hypothetical protein
MSNIKIFKQKQPWRDALIATTGLSVFVLAATLLWKSRYPEWAFALSFVSIWVLISISWSYIDFTEQSGSILAGIMDHNFDKMHSRVEQLEAELFALRQNPDSARENISTGRG